jgi:transposase InsO family protein
MAYQNGKYRFCVDYRKLNALTTKDRYPLPLIDELLERLSKARIFTKLDIRQGFHRIRIDSESEDLTTFRTRYGQFKYKVMPFGLTNGPAIFQRFVNNIFKDCLDQFLTAFIDDLLIYSSNKEEHETHVKIVLQRLQEAGLQAAIKKSEFHVTKTKYLGFIVSTDGISVDPEKTAVIREWQTPTTVKGVQSFLGFCNFYRRFIRGYSQIAKPLNALQRKNTPFTWTAKCAKAFEQLKQRLSEAPLLHHFRPELETKLETDASDGTVAGALSQKAEDGHWHPVAFYSKSMAVAEQNYDIHDKEMLAVIRALEEWRAELQSLQRSERFAIFTDHRALEYFMTTKKLSARQARWAEFLSRFYFLIKYHTGKSNIIADILSRKDGAPDHDSRMQILLRPEMVEKAARKDIGIATLEAESGEESIMEEIKQANRDAESLQGQKGVAKSEKPGEWGIRDDDILTFQDRLVVPTEAPYEDLRGRLMNEIHRQGSIAHPGIRKMKKLIKPRFYWRGWNSDVERYVSNCKKCRRAANPRDKKPGLLQPLPIPDRPWQHLSMDFHSMPKDRSGYDNVCVFVCRLSKKPISIPCYKDVTARDMARLFIEHVYRHHGAPDSIVSDRGPQFISEFWTELCRILGIKLKLSTAGHPETDGQTEIMNQLLTMRLRPLIDYYQDNWAEMLPLIDHAAMVLPSESTGLSPAYIEKGYEPRVSFD